MENVSPMPRVQRRQREDAARYGARFCLRVVPGPHLPRPILRLASWRGEGADGDPTARKWTVGPHGVTDVPEFDEVIVSRRDELRRALFGVDGPAGGRRLRPSG